MADTVQNMIDRRLDFVVRMIEQSQMEVPLETRMSDKPAVEDPTGVAELPPSPPREKDKHW